MTKSGREVVKERKLIGETRRTVFRHIFVALPVFMICAAAVGFFAMQSVATFTADSSVFVLFGREFIYRPEIGSPERSEALKLSEIVNTEVQILESRDLAEHVVETLSAETLYPEIFLEEPDATIAHRKATLEFRDAVSVLPILESSVITVSFTHVDAELASQSVNLLVDAFLERHLELFRGSPASFVDEKLVLWNERLAETETQLLALKEAHGFVDLHQQTLHLLAQDAELKRTWIAHEAALAEVHSRREHLEPLSEVRIEPSNAKLLGGVDVSATVAILEERRSAFSAQWNITFLRVLELENRLVSQANLDPAVVAATEGPEFRGLDPARTRLLELKVEREGLLHSYRGNSRRVRSVEQEIRAVEEFLSMRVAGVNESLIMTAGRALATDHATSTALLSELERNVEEIDRSILLRQLLDLDEIEASILAQATTTETLRSAVSQEIRDLDSVSQKVQRLERELATCERNLASYEQKREDAHVSADLDRQKRSSVRVLERATPPIQASGLSPKLKIALGLVAGAFAAVAAAVGVEMMRGGETRGE